MATRKQIRANRRNARKSTGPRTEAGKAASSANALSHGLTAAGTVVLPEEEPEEFERLRQGVIADLAPAGTLQQALAQRVAQLLWRLDRVARLEAELFAHGQLALQHKSLNREDNRALVSHTFAQHLGEEEMKAMEPRRRRRLHIDASMRAEAPSGQVLAERQESARAYDQLARHEATLQRALDRTLAEFRRLREAANAEAVPEAAPADPDPAPVASADPDPAPASDTRPAGPQVSPGATGESRAGAALGGEKGILQNEPNSAQRIEGEENFGAGANPSTAPTVA